MLADGTFSSEWLQTRRVVLAKGREKSREMQRMHIKTANPAVQSLPQDQTHIPAVRDRRYLRGRFERVKALAGLLD